MKCIVKVKTQVFKCTGLMPSDLCNPYIHSATALCDSTATPPQCLSFQQLVLLHASTFARSLTHYDLAAELCASPLQETSISSDTISMHSSKLTISLPCCFAYLIVSCLNTKKDGGILVSSPRLASLIFFRITSNIALSSLFGES